MLCVCVCVYRYSKLARTEEQRTLFLGRVDSPPQPYDIHDLKNILAAQDQ